MRQYWDYKKFCRGSTSLCIHAGNSSSYLNYHVLLPQQRQKAAFFAQSPKIHDKKHWFLDTISVD